jgi:hypothetical protein
MQGLKIKPVDVADIQEEESHVFRTIEKKPESRIGNMSGKFSGKIAFLNYQNAGSACSGHVICDVRWRC